MSSGKDKAIEFKTLPKVAFADKNKRKRARARAKKKKSLNIDNIGEYIDGEGVFIGIYKPKDRDGDSLGRIFNLFAAKEDLGDAASYKETVKKLKSIKSLDGHAGKHFENESELYRAFKDRSYNGDWFIPTKNMLIDVKLLEGEYLVMLHGTLYDNKNKGCLKNSFNLEYNGNDFSHRYWSCTEDSNNSSQAYNLDLKDGHLLKLNKTGFELSTRLVRASPRV